MTRNKNSNLNVVNFSAIAAALTTFLLDVFLTARASQIKTPTKQGGAVAGNARRELEHKSGKRVSTKQNYLRSHDKKQLH